jgi:hypothetical protein
LEDSIDVMTNDRGNIKAEIIDDLTITLTDTMGYIRKLEGFQLTLEGEINQVRSLVLEETELKVTEFEGVAKKILTLETSLTNTNTKIEARVAEESLARVNMDGALARHIVGVQAEALTAASDAYASAHAELVAFAGPYSSMAAYNIDVTAAYEGYADTVAGTAQTNAEATAAAALTTFAGEYETLAEFNVDLTAAYQGYADTAQSNAEATAASQLSTFAGPHGSLAEFQTTLTTTYNDTYASLSSFNTLDNSVDGVLLKHGVTGTINGVTGGFIFTGVQKLDGTVSYGLEINGDVIVDGSLHATKLHADVADFFEANVTNLNATNINSNYALYNVSEKVTSTTQIIVSWNASTDSGNTKKQTKTIFTHTYVPVKGNLILAGSLTLSAGSGSNLGTASVSLNVWVEIVVSGAVVRSIPIVQNLAVKPPNLAGYVQYLDPKFVTATAGVSTIIRVKAEGSILGNQSNCDATWNITSFSFSIIEPNGET